ncbi:MAG: hypothetical protein WBB27_00965 [Maribacter sp.]
MEYKKEFRNIGFRVVFCHYPHQKGVLAFAAQPYEKLMQGKSGRETGAFLLYGKIEKGERLEVGFREFSFEMTDNLHKRLGELFELIKLEYRNTILKVYKNMD